MKEYIELISDYFVDFQGNRHYFVIAAISEKLPTKVKNLYDSDYYDVKDDSNVYTEVSIAIEDYGSVECIGNVVKTLKIGIAICNPEDEFDEQIGFKKAIARAKKSEPVLYSSSLGAINSDVVKAFLKQESEYFKNNPGKYIKGYDNKKIKYIKNLEMNEKFNKFSKSEKEIISKALENYEFFNDIISYIEWAKKQDTK